MTFARFPTDIIDEIYRHIVPNTDRRILARVCRATAREIPRLPNISHQIDIYAPQQTYLMLELAYDDRQIIRNQIGKHRENINLLLLICLDNIDAIFKYLCDRTDIDSLTCRFFRTSVENNINSIGAPAIYLDRKNIMKWLIAERNMKEPWISEWAWAATKCENYTVLELLCQNNHSHNLRYRSAMINNKLRVLRWMGASNYKMNQKITYQNYVEIQKSIIGGHIDRQCDAWARANWPEYASHAARFHEIGFHDEHR